MYKYTVMAQGHWGLGYQNQGYHHQFSEPCQLPCRNIQPEKAKGWIYLPRVRTSSFSSWQVKSNSGNGLKWLQCQDVDNARRLEYLPAQASLWRTWRTGVCWTWNRKVSFSVRSNTIFTAHQSHIWLCGLLTVHKPDVALHPIVSFMSLPAYALFKSLPPCCHPPSALLTPMLVLYGI